MAEENLMRQMPKVLRVGSPRRKEDAETSFRLPIDEMEGEVIIQEKLDGCMPYKQRIPTKDKGSVPIGKIVNQEMDVEVLSYNSDKKRMEYKPVTEFYKNGSTDDWLKIELDGSMKQNVLKVTPNHEVYTSEGKKQAGDLEPGDKLLSHNPKLSGELRSLILGSVIGDGRLENPLKDKSSHLQESHGEKQHDYTRWKVKRLGEWVNNVYTQESAYDTEHPVTEKLTYTTKSLASLDSLAERFYKEKAQVIPKDIGIDEKALAIIYCDDGSLNKGGDVQRPRATLNVQGFDRESVENLKRGIESLGFELRKVDYGKGWRLEFNTEDSQKLFERISEFIPECMEYKLPEEYRTEGDKWSKLSYDLHEVEVSSISDFTPHNKTKYDIEVEDNHNYFTKGVLVSNSNFRFSIHNDQILFGSKKQEFIQDGEPLSPEELPGQYVKAAKVIQEDVGVEKLKEVEEWWVDGLEHGLNDVITQGMEEVDHGFLTFFSENMVLHSFDYDWDNTPQVIGFDIYDDITEEFIHPRRAEEAFDRMGIQTAPIHRRVTIHEDFKPREIERMKIPESAYRRGEKAEGLVIKNARNQIYAKLHNEEFSELNEESFNIAKSNAETDEEKVVARYCTNRRILKLIQKEVIQEDKELSMELMEDKLHHKVLNDIFEEEYPDIIYSRYEIDFYLLRKHIADRVRKVLKRRINIKERNEISDQEALAKRWDDW